MGSPQVNVSALHEWRGILANMGLDEGSADVAERSAFAGTSLPTADLKGFVGLLERAGDESDRDDLSWAVGLSSDYATRGKVGRTIIGSKTLGHALRRLEEFYPLIQDATLLKFEVEDDWATLNYKILDPEIWPRQQDALYSLGLYAGLVKIAAPDVWSEVEITVEAERESLQAELTRIVDAPVCYGGSTNNLRFPASALSSPLALAPSTDKDLLKQLSSDLVQKKRSTPLSDRARQLIFSEICDGDVTQDKIAKALGLSSRTLRRKLSSENLSFQGLLDECRMQVAALDFKTRDVVSLSELALKLGYSEHSTFSRAFARWAGMSPQDYRRSTFVH